LNGFGGLLLLDPEGCRPFDEKRSGISLGEGAGVLVLEAEEVARARGASILAWLSGWGTSCDASHPTAPHPQAEGAVLAMRRALERSGLSPNDIDYLSAHGTGTPDNDAMEALALRRVFGEVIPPFSSVKRFFGHTLAASGAIKAALCVQAILHQSVLPNLGFENFDPKLGLTPARQFEPRRLQYVLSNSFGFGGNNVVLVFSDTARREAPGCGAKAPAVEAIGAGLGQPEPSIRSRQERVAIVGAGLVSAAGGTFATVGEALRAGGSEPSWLEMTSSFPSGKARGYSCSEFGAGEAIPLAKRRRLGHLQQMMLVAAKQSLSGRPPGTIAPGRACTAVGTGLGSLGETAAFLENMVRNEERAPLAGRFTNSVHNAGTSQLAIEFGLSGMNSTPTHREISFECALWLGANELRHGQADLALVGAGDELSPYLQAAGERWGWWNESSPVARPFGESLSGRQRPLPGEGAAIFTLVHDAEKVEVLGYLDSVRMGRAAVRTNGRFDTEEEAKWIEETLAGDGVPLKSVDVLLCGASGWPPLDNAYADVAAALSHLRGEELGCGSYKQACGEFYSASAFGFYVALGMIRGEIDPAPCLRGSGIGACRNPPRSVLLYTLAPTGSHALCCVCA
jgi:3-oxoacyl-(acyl-carrier-protein) synthase